MCFKKLFNKPEREELHPARRALLFGINDYPGDSSDLNGCVNDVYDVKEKLDSLYPDFVTKIFTDSNATISTFEYELAKEVEKLQAGDVLLIHYSGHGTYVTDKNGDEQDGYDEALYLYDGPLIDDDIRGMLEGIPEGATVILIFDCCYSGTITRSVALKKEKNRFYPSPVGKKSTGSLKIKNRFAKGNDMRWITFSGSGEHQTSADAYINGRYNGAFTYFLLKLLKPGITYKQWAGYVSEAFEGSRFEQRPQIEGPEGLLNNIVFYI